MLTIKQIRDDKEAAARKLAKKGVDAAPVIEKIISFDDRRKALQLELDNTLAAQNKAAKEIGALMGQGRRDEAEERIRRIAAPQNVARHPGFRTPCAKTGVCADCNSQDRICNTRMEMLRCWPDKRVLVILIDEDSGL